MAGMHVRSRFCGGQGACGEGFEAVPQAIWKAEIVIIERKMMRDFPRDRQPDVHLWSGNFQGRCGVFALLLPGSRNVDSAQVDHKCIQQFGVIERFGASPFD